MRATREQLDTRNHELSAENTLLIQYVSDVENGIAPTAIEHEGKGLERIEGKLYRPFAGHGGIVVMRFRVDDGNGLHRWNAHVTLLDDYIQCMQADYSEHTVNLRALLERLRIARNRAYDAQKAS